MPSGTNPIQALAAETKILPRADPRLIGDFRPESRRITVARGIIRRQF